MLYILYFIWNIIDFFETKYDWLMTTKKLFQLESSITQLLKNCDLLQKKNNELQIERQELLDKNQQASHKIECMIKRLKTIND
jgi:uncharacterized protein (TIGR02449 family)